MGLKCLAALLALTTVCYGSYEKCVTSPSNDVQLHVVSRRNMTGHWTVSINMMNAELNSPDNKKPPKKISMNIGQKTTACEELELHQLEILTTVSRRSPPTDYEVMLGLGYYKWHAMALSWIDAREKCEQEGAHLIIINSESEANVVKEFFARKPIIQNATRDYGVYVGLHDRYTEGQILTLFGEPLKSTGYVRFASGEPNGGTVENCIAMSKDGSYFDISCTTWRLAFICEYNIL